MLYLPADAAAQLDALLDQGVHVAPTNQNGTPVFRTWRAQASNKPGSIAKFARIASTSGLIARLGHGVVVLTARGQRSEGLAPLEVRLGALPTTVTSRVATLTAYWFRAPPQLPSAVLSTSVSLRSGVEGIAVPPSLTRDQNRWRWVRAPASFAIAPLPAALVDEVRRLAEGGLAEAA